MRRVFETHDYTLEYVRELSLPLVPYDIGSGGFYGQGPSLIALKDRKS